MNPMWCAVIPQVLCLVIAMHKAGWVHRDVRPSNIVRYHDRVILVDYAAAAPVDIPALYSGSARWVAVSACVRHPLKWPYRGGLGDMCRSASSHLE
jgi:serine/threonine protein kinase